MRALVTGGRGGIGREIVDLLVRREYDVVVADVTQPGPGISQERVEHAQVDLTTTEGVRDAVARATGSSGIDVLVNCLGISPKRNGRAPTITEITDDEWDEVFRVNVTSCFRTMREAWNSFVPHDNASVVNVVSAVAKLGASGPEGTQFGLTHPAGIHYCASKAALASLTTSAARSLAQLGVRCNGVAPGYINSGMRNSTNIEVEEAVVRQLPLGRAGTSAEVAAAVGFLVSPEARYITGEILDVDGGWNPD